MVNNNFLKQTITDALSLFFPQSCEVCGDVLVYGEKVICLSCLSEIPRTNFHLHSGNTLEKVFWGRTRLERVSAYFHYTKGSAYQKLLHRLKYEGRKEIGYEIGRLYGAELKSTGVFSDVDYLIPIPLHPKKEKKRGYNQSLQIANGLAESLGIPVRPDLIRRTHFTDTQTNKSRIERWENVSEIFSVQDSNALTDKHLVLVDDVITTGATIEACSEVINAAARCKISAISMAVA